MLAQKAGTGSTFGSFVVAMLGVNAGETMVETCGNWKHLESILICLEV